MKKLIFAAAISLLLCAGGAALWAHVSSDEFLDANAEALRDSNPKFDPCWYINVQASDAPLLLSCSDCRLHHGYGKQVAGCPAVEN